MLKEGPSCGVTLRATYIIDPKGIVRHISINDLPVGRSVDELLRLVKAFMHSETLGEVCPAEW
jgi:peroxiredoxin (alkyl hydroperoxide reductase subunit C)